MKQKRLFKQITHEAFPVVILNLEKNQKFKSEILIFLGLQGLVCTSRNTVTIQSFTEITVF